MLQLWPDLAMEDVTFPASSAIATPAFLFKPTHYLVLIFLFDKIATLQLRAVPGFPHAETQSVREEAGHPNKIGEVLQFNHAYQQRMDG